MKTVYISGIAVAITPFLGIPYSWKTLLLVILGLVIFTKGYYYYKKNKKEVKQLEVSFKQNEQPADIVATSGIFKDDKNIEKENLENIQKIKEDGGKK